MRRLLLAALAAVALTVGVAHAQTTTTQPLRPGCNPTGAVTVNGEPIIACVDVAAPTTTTTVRIAQPAVTTPARRVALTG